MRCSNCDSPICPECMIETPVGHKCLSCGRVEFRSPAAGRRYAAGGAGLVAAAVLQTLLAVLPLGILALATPLVVGYVTGSVVRAAGGGNFGLGPTAAIATACGMAMGVLFLGVPLAGLFRVGFLFAAGIGAYVAHYRATR